MSFQKFWAKVTKLLKETIQMNEDLGVKLRPKSLIVSPTCFLCKNFIKTPPNRSVIISEVIMAIPALKEI